MAKVVVLGGAGAVGRVAAKTLVAHEAFNEVVIADIDLKTAASLAADFGPGATSAWIDANDRASVAAAVAGADVVVNCTGPFYKFARPILEVVVAAGIDYVDVCDDVDATLDLLSMDGMVKEAGVRALVGMGNSPGVTNVLARFAADQLLEEVEAIDIFHAHGGEAFEGPGVVAHRLHGMGMEIPMYLDGELKSLRFFGADGVAIRTKVDMYKVGDQVPVYPYPHPEQITIPQHISCRQVTNRGTVIPDEYFELTCDVAKTGMTREAPLAVGDQTVIPRDVAISFLLERRDEILRETKFGGQRGCTMVEVRGTNRGLARTYRFQMASESEALGEGTGIPAALGAILMLEGKIKGPGVLPPEAALDPLDFLAGVSAVLPVNSDGKAFDGFLVEKIDEQGQIEKIDLPI